MARDVTSTAGEGESQKLPYEKPAIAWEEKMDARPGLMAACQKVSGVTSTDCGSAPGS